MKKKLEYFICCLLAGVVGLSSCRKDLLVTVPTDRISSNIFWNTELDVTIAANSIYTYLENGVDLQFWDAFSDIAHVNPTGVAEAPVAQGIFDAQNSRVAGQWSTGYNGIRAANYFLENIDKVQTINTALINNLKGQVKTLRAYYYLRLLSWYGAVPLVTKSITIDEAKQVKRDSVAKIYDFIGLELTEAAQFLPVRQTDKGRITKGAALAIKARAMLYARRYQESADAGKEVMDLNQYSLYSWYRDLFSYAAENNNEIILDKQFVKDIYSSTIFTNTAPSSQASSVPLVVPTKIIADEYETRNGKSISDPSSNFDPFNPYFNRDPRMRYSIFVPGDTLPSGDIFNSTPGSGTADAIGGGNLYATTTGYNIKKYVNKEDLSAPQNSGINIILLRYAEVLLTYAEAKIELNQIDQSVYDAINLVRQRPDVNMPPIAPGQTQSQLRAAVRHERMVELAFEGLHGIDVRRWRTAENVIPGPVKGMTYVRSGQLITIVNNSIVRTFNPNRDYLWPLPQQEIILNKNLGQNPNW